MTNTWRWTRKQWFAIPLKLRQRWWAETNYSQIAPSRELVANVESALWECGAATI